MKKTQQNNMFSITTLILAALYSGSVKSDSILFPISTKINPQPMILGDVHCDLTFPYDMKTHYSTQIIKTKTPESINNKARGYLCTKEEWISTCYENILGHQDKTFSTTPSAITPSECREAVLLDFKGLLHPPVKPNYQCSWLSTSSNVEHYTMVKEHDVVFNHYHMAYVDSIFFRGDCKSDSCETKYDNIIWIAESDLPITCPGGISSTVSFHYPYDQLTLANTLVESPLIPAEALINACRGLTYCNETYYLTKYGHGFQVPRTVENTAIVDLLSNLPVCGHRTIMTSGSTEKDLMTKHLLEDSERYERCLDSVEKGLSKGQLSRRDVHFLSPLIAGSGIGFLLINGTIWRDEVEYIMIHDYQMKCSRFSQTCLLQFLSSSNENKNVTIPCLRMFPVGGKGVCNWYNGIVLTQDKIILPEQGLLEREMQDLYLIQHILNYDLDIVYNSTGRIHLSEIRRLPKQVNGDLISYLESGTGSFGKRILIWLGFLLMGLILIYAIIKLGPVVFRSLKRKDSPTRRIVYTQPIRGIDGNVLIDRV